MKKIIFITVISVLLVACSAQQRLNCLLEHHPELKYIDTVTFNDTICITDTLYLEKESDSVKMTLQDLIRMDSLKNANPKGTLTKEIETKHSQAKIEANGNGIFTLHTGTKPDTIILNDTIYKPRLFFIPTYKTKTEYKEKIVYKMHWYEQIPFWIGITCILYIIITCIRKWVI